MGFRTSAIKLYSFNKCLEMLWKGSLTFTLIIMLETERFLQPLIWSEDDRWSANQRPKIILSISQNRLVVSATG